MRIMHLLTSNTYSGAENVCINLMKIAENDYDVYYVSVNGPIKNKLKSLNLKYLPLNKFSFSEVRKAIYLIKPDIVHAHDIKASVYSTLLCNCPIVSHIHGKFDDMSKLSLKSLLYFFCSYKFSKIFYVSKSIYEEFYFKKILDKKGKYLPNRIDENIIKQRLEKVDDCKKYDLIYIGRLEAVKDPIKFLRVVEKVQMAKSDITVCMVGDGSLNTECIKMIKKLELNVDMVGFQEEPLKYLKESKILVITSVREGLPMVSLEAIAANKPIISTPTDGMKELIRNHKNGVLALEIDDIAQECLELIRNTDKYNIMVNYIKRNSLNEFDVYRKSVLNTYSTIIK